MELKLLAQLITKLRKRVFSYEEEKLDPTIHEHEAIELKGRISGLKEAIEILAQPFLPPRGRKPMASIKRSRRERDAMRDSDRRAGFRD